MISSSLALYYNHPDSAIEIRKTCIRQTLRPTEILVAVSALELTHFDAKLKKFSHITRTKFAGRSFSGRILEVGALVEHLQPGDRVCGCFKSLTMEFIGTFSIFDTERHIVFRAPSYLSDFQATGFPLSFGTAWELAFNRTPSLERSSTILVVGGGTPIGFMLIQLLQKLFNLNAITVVCSSSSVDRVRDLGIERVIDDSHDLVPALVESVGAESKFTVIYDCAGGYDSLSVWPRILKDSTHGGMYLTIRGDAPALNKSESFHSLVKNAVPYIPRNVARLALGRLTGIDYHFVTWSDIPVNAIDYAAKTEFQFLESNVWTINDAQQAMDYLKSLETGARVVIDMASTPRDVQELGTDCSEEQLRYSEYLRYSRLKKRLRSSVYRAIANSPPLKKEQKLDDNADAPNDPFQEPVTPQVVQLSPEIDLSPENLGTPNTDEVQNAPLIEEVNNESTRESFNSKFKRMFKKKENESDRSIKSESSHGPRDKPKFVVPRWLGGKKSPALSAAPEAGNSPQNTLSIIVEAK